MEFSSSTSSDGELEEELRRNYRRECTEQRGIVRASSSERQRALRFPLPNGHSVEVRQGTIYIPTREAYVHVLQARRRPERWFGDGRIPIRRRRPLAPQAVVLQRVLGNAAEGRLEEVSLSEATENDFYLFKGVRGSTPLNDESVGGTSTKVSHPIMPTAHLKPSAWQDPFSDTRYQRITSMRPWRFAADHPRTLSKATHDAWDTTGDFLSPADVCCYDTHLGIIWRFAPRERALYVVRYHGAGDGGEWGSDGRRAPFLSHTLVSTIPYSSITAIGIACIQLSGLEDDDSVGNTSAERNAYGERCRLLIFGTTQVVCLLVYYSSDVPFRSVEVAAEVQVSCVGSISLHVPAVTCWCTSGRVTEGAWPTSASLSFFVGAGRSIYKWAWPQQLQSNRDLHRMRLTSFATTDVTALVTHTGVFGDSTAPAVVAGMRNGTIQVVPASEMNRQRAFGGGYRVAFNTVTRHSGSDITAMYQVSRLPYGVVSVARNGEAKLWDLRFMGAEKEPVLTLLASQPGGGQVGACSTSMSGWILASASASGGLVCVDAIRGTRLFHTDQNGSPATRVVLGSTNSRDFELYAFSPHLMERYQLRI